MLKAPIDGDLGRVASGFVGPNGGNQRWLVTVASLQAVSGQRAEFNLGHVQPTGVFGRVVKLQALGKAPSLTGGESHVQGCRTVDVEK